MHIGMYSLEQSDAADEVIQGQGSWMVTSGAVPAPATVKTC